MNKITLGAYFEEDPHAYHVVRIGKPSEKIWSQTPNGLGAAFSNSILCNEISPEEYKHAALIDIFPVSNIGTRPAKPSELGNLIVGLVENLEVNVTLHAKPLEVNR
jgi:hypothetical protein